MLKDADCSSNAARLFQLYASDDRTTKQDFKLVDTDHTAQVPRFVIDHAGAGRGLADRLGRLLKLARQGEEWATELITKRCKRGADIARQPGFNEDVAAGIHSLDQHWNGRGRPVGLQGDAIPCRPTSTCHAAMSALRAHGTGDQ